MSTELLPREKECCCLAAQGYLRKEIGQMLGISDKAVMHQIENACDKLGVKRVARLTHYCLAQGWIKNLYSGEPNG